MPDYYADDAAEVDEFDTDADGQQIPAAFTWAGFRPADENYSELGAALGLHPRSVDLFRRATYPPGLVQVRLDSSNSAAIHEVTPEALWALSVDRLQVRVLTPKGLPSGSPIARAHLVAMLQSARFLRHFRPLSEIVTRPVYVADGSTNCKLLMPGYHDLEDGVAILYAGPEPDIADTTEAIDLFLRAMDFDCEASRTNAVAGALTAMLRRCWPGGKPLIPVTANKSHAGKGTLVDFIVGLEPTGGTIAYTATGWAMEKAVHDQLRASSHIGILQVDNVDLDSRARVIHSATIERMVTDPAPMLCSSKARQGLRLAPNHLVITITTNCGQLSPDLLNRSLPIRLQTTGDVHLRQSPIGNPRLEFLPQNRERIAAELRGLIARWQAAGSPLDMSVIHPFALWARTIGGILQVGGYRNFLANYGARKAADDPIIEALAILGAKLGNDEWWTATDLVEPLLTAGLEHRLIPAGERGSIEAMARRLGTVLSAHIGETLEWADPHKGITVRLHIEKSRLQRWRQYDKEHRHRRETAPDAHHRYRFVPIYEPSVGVIRCDTQPVPT